MYPRGHCSRHVQPALPLDYFPPRPLSHSPETVNHPHGEPSADLQNAAACRDRLPTVCDSYVRNRRVLTGCDLVIEMPDCRIREIRRKSGRKSRTTETQTSLWFAPYRSLRNDKLGRSNVQSKDNEIQLLHKACKRRFFRTCEFPRFIVYHREHTYREGV